MRRAAIYVPGGRAPYPSTVVMGVVTARAAGVEEVVVLTPGPVDPVIRGACALCGVEEVYAIGGAHGIAALAYGTETIARVDVIAGPGSLIVQEAKRQVSDVVGIDGFYGPSDVLVFADATADPYLIALRPARPGRARPGRAGRRGQRLVAAAARGRATRWRRSGPRASTPTRPRSCSCTRRRCWRRSRSARPSRPSTSSSSARPSSASRRACAPPAASSSAPRARPPSATTSPARTTRCRPAARRASPPACRRASSAAA